MQQEVSFLSYMLWHVGNLAFFVISLLVLRFVAKLKWLTAICLSVFATTIILILGLRILIGASPKIGSIFLLPAVVCGVIMIIQFFLWVISGDNTSDNAAERDKILKMMEEGKINTQEGTELLDAIGRSSAMRGEEKFSRVDMVMLIGVALVVLGFFLPWVYIRMGEMPGPFGRVSGYQAGYHAGAMGWAVLIIVIASAIPIFITPKNFLYKISMLQIFLILIGTILVISILVQAGGKLGPGLIFCLVGFVVELFGSGVKFRKLAA
ncbi:MAG: hypothetical protein ACYTDW_04320 [Planctomycetota bacterium]|jgi:hypothetical protein